MPEETKTPAKRVSNPEIATLAQVAKLMDELDGPAQGRTLAWLLSTYSSPAAQEAIKKAVCYIHGVAVHEGQMLK